MTRDGAREEARRELSRGIYQDARPSWFDRATSWINDKLSDIWHWLTPDTGSGVGSFRGLGVFALVIVLVVLVVVLRLWLGPVRRTARDDEGEAALSSPLTATQLRALARAQADRDEYADAVRSGMRAIARMLEERAVLDPRPGRTAGELITDLRAAIRPAAPALATPGPAGTGADGDGRPGEPAIRALADAVEVFSEIWYGGRPASREAYEKVLRADEELGRVRRRSGRDLSADNSPPVPA
ncbi:DUF4129 domain-containing protein [Frankia sp. EI5c]|uniref:DUF4129 domain-containing protein n=1 Tax=Frankia sp. EI5c TaxID=683316 RepID=UPI0028C46FD7|nr:DUF4129 domain-containing protein [Frankia sp. EI5c]